MPYRAFLCCATFVAGTVVGEFSRLQRPQSGRFNLNLRANAGAIQSEFRFLRQRKERTRGVTLNERGLRPRGVLRISGIIAIVVLILVGMHIYSQQNLQTITGHVSGGELTYSYPQSGQRRVTAIRFTPVSLSQFPENADENSRVTWSSGTELILCGDVQSQFVGKHWVNVTYGEATQENGCSQLESVTDVKHQESPARIKEMCDELYQSTRRRTFLVAMPRVPQLAGAPPI